jgi:tetratricopeptide (TPR) repeat protein
MIAVILLGLVLQAAPQSAPPARTAVPDRATLLARASDALQQGNRAEAKRLLEIAGRDRQSVQALLQLARLQLDDRDPAAAMQTLGKAQRLAPNSEEVLAAIAELSLAARAPVPAILTLESMTRLYPDEPRYAYLLGVALMGAGDVPAAIEALRKANTLQPGQRLTLLALGLAYNNQKLFTDAYPTLRKALDLDPENLETIAAVSEAEAGTGDLTAAERDATRAIARAPQNATANLVLGMVRLAQQRYPEARDALLVAAASDPVSPKPEYQLSLVYARLGDQASSDRHRSLYQDKLRALEASLAALHSTSPGTSGK